MPHLTVRKGTSTINHQSLVPNYFVDLAGFQSLIPPVAAALCLKAPTLLLIFSSSSDCHYLLIKFVQSVFFFTSATQTVWEHCAFNISFEKDSSCSPPHALQLCTSIHTAIPHAILCKPIPNGTSFIRLYLIFVLQLYFSGENHVPS